MLASLVWLAEEDRKGRGSPAHGEIPAGKGLWRSCSIRTHLDRVAGLVESNLGYVQGWRFPGISVTFHSLGFFSPLYLIRISHMLDGVLSSLLIGSQASQEP